MKTKLKDPFSSISHLFGAVAAIPVTILLLLMSKGTVRVASFAIFGAALFLLYSASGVYHAVIAEKASKIWRRIDHMMIFVLIAGTYTPICAIALNGALGGALLTIIWVLAIVGILLIGVWIKLPRWVSAVIYVVMGWIVVTSFSQLTTAIGKGTNLLLWGGACYTVGAVIYSLGHVKKLSSLLPKKFGFHEIFHIFILFGSAFHIAMMFLYIL